MNRRDAETVRDPVTERVIGLAIEVHRTLGPGLLESAYEECLAYELAQKQIRFQRQLPLPIVYKAVQLECGYRIDFVIDEWLIVELKTLEKLLPIHEAQLLTYLKLTGLKVGLLMNFNVPS
jgi:GxxExxY protein